MGRDLKAHPIPPPAMGRDPSHCPGVLRARSGLALGTCRHGAATVALDNSKQINPFFYIGTLCYWNRPV